MLFIHFKKRESILNCCVITKKWKYELWYHYSTQEFSQFCSLHLVEASSPHSGQAIQEISESCMQTGSELDSSTNSYWDGEAKGDYSEIQEISSNRGVFITLLSGGGSQAYAEGKVIWISDYMMFLQ